MEPTLNQQAYDIIRRRLFRGELPPGTRLVNRTLAEEIGMSFTPVREAINRLASDGLVEYTHGAGAYVRKLDRQELAQLYDVRMLFEPFAAAEAASHITANEIAEIESLMGRWEELATDISGRTRAATPTQMNTWLEFDERFHELVVTACRNKWIAKIMGDLRVVSQCFAAQRSAPGILTKELVIDTCRSHRKLLDALKNRDPDEASELVKKQLLVRCALSKQYGDQKFQESNLVVFAQKREPLSVENPDRSHAVF